MTKDESEMISQLKEKFHETKNQSEKIRILTVLPKSWSQRKIASEFGTTRHTAAVAKKLVEEKGVLSDPNPKKGCRIEADIVKKVEEFYLSEEISRIMPGKKDTISVFVDGSRKAIQKHLILCNLKEAYAQFKEKNPAAKIGFSKFAELRPKQCVLPGSSGTHSVCVCTIHQNMKLMFVGSHLANLTSNEEQPLRTPQDCVQKLQCNPPSVNCCLGQCSECGSTTVLSEQIERVFDENFIDTVTFKKWTCTDRSNLETVVQKIDEFLPEFLITLRDYQKHAFLTKMQSNYYKELKETLQQGEVLVVLDFAENYSFVVQDEVQSFHWNNTMATVHPFVVYFQEDGRLKNKNFVVISECNVHDTVAVHLFLRYLFDFLRTELPLTKKVIYFSDGCAAQYKNCKNFLNLCCHEEDFGIPAEWHFFTTSHGKGPCDGLGGTVKRLAARASLQRPHDKQILTAAAFFQFCEESIPNINFKFSTNQDYEAEERKLKERHLSAITIAGTQKLHAFKPLNANCLEVRYFSASSEAEIKKVSDSSQKVSDNDIFGYVTAVYDQEWYLGYVLEKDKDLKHAKLTFLEPKGPSRSFNYPYKADILTVPFADILTSVDATTSNGRSYMLSKEEQVKASEILKIRKKQK